MRHRIDQRSWPQRLAVPRQLSSPPLRCPSASPASSVRCIRQGARVRPLSKHSERLLSAIEEAAHLTGKTWAGSRGGGLPCPDGCRTPGLADAAVNRRPSLARYHREIEKQRLYRQGGAFCFAVD